MNPAQIVRADAQIARPAEGDRNPCGLLDELEELLGALSSEWVTSRPAAIRRSEVRKRCDYPGWITPLDQLAESDETTPAAVRISTVSRRGIGLIHTGPLPHRLVAVRFALSGSTSPELVVRLHWCRFRGPGAYESGGRIECVLGRQGVRRRDR